MSLISICMISIIIVLMAVKLKKINGEYSTLLSIAMCILIVAFIISRLSQVISYIDKITGYIDVNMEYISLILKMLVISYICEFSSNICRDAGFNAISTHIELAGRITMMVMSLPILFNVLDMVVMLLK